MHRVRRPGFATHICDVEVDKKTGYLKILRYTAVQDVGCAIYPAMSRARSSAASPRGSAGR
jgi:CO/xanthine dehydrogenase Mo-binding subunit